MAIDRKKFFDEVRNNPFHGLDNSQVAGIEAILDEWEKRDLTDLRWLGYMLATAWWETAHTMEPLREYGRGLGRPYGRPVNGLIYYGRGYVQLTWVGNYRKMGDLLKVDLVANPDLALSPPVAAQIMFEGMIRGTFTGKKLSNYFTASASDWAGARRIINGLDHAVTIGEVANHFYTALH